MALQKINIEEFLELARQYPVLDVRSPGEYNHAHMPGAYSLPLFTDEERKIVGTLYKQAGRSAAIKAGLDYFGVKMRKMVEEVENLVNSRKTGGVTGEMENHGRVLVHCWRGGMRSAGVAWLLDLYGFKVYTLAGGYKMYRQWVRLQFKTNYSLIILGGYTGSGKTAVLQELRRLGKAVIDLEGLASHKGSAFGALGENPQPSQELFENLLAGELSVFKSQSLCFAGSHSPLNDEMDVIYIEDESQRIGLLNIPADFWNTMRNSEVRFIDIPFEERLCYLTGEYGQFRKEDLVNAILRIQKRLGGQETKTAINYLLENNYQECFRVLLKYYDKCYRKGMLKREIVHISLNKIPCTGIEINTITNKLINERAKA